MINLHTHTVYSPLDGLVKIDDMLKWASTNGVEAMAITDHGTITGAADFFKKAKKAGIKPIIGCELYVVDNEEGEKGEKRYHLLALAKDQAGWESLLRALNTGHKQFYRRPRITWEQALTLEGCIICSGCSFGLLHHPDYISLASRFKNKYGEDFYLEIMPHDIPEQHEVNSRAMSLRSALGVKLVATNDAHYTNAEDALAHEVLLAVQTSSSWVRPDRWKFSTDGFHLRTKTEMVMAFKKNCPYLGSEQVIESIRSTYEINNKVVFELQNSPVLLPNPYEGQVDAKVYLDAVRAGYASKIAGTDKDNTTYKRRLMYEIEVIAKAGYLRYFLIVADIINQAREVGIMVGPGRGSAAGSLVCFLLGITQVDPIEHGLYFERFLNPDRIDLPDIDVDFQDDRRDEVFKYVEEKYGSEFVSRINTFGYLKPKSAFLDVCRVFDIPAFEAQQLSKQICESAEKRDGAPLYTEETCFDFVPDLVKFKTKKIKIGYQYVSGEFIIEQSKRIAGAIRQEGQHAAGVVVSQNPIRDVSVVENRQGASVCCWDKRSCEGFGLIKIDVLGLKTLGILSRAKEMLAERGVYIEFTEIPFQDEKTLEYFRAGYGVGVFQFENGGMQSLLRDINPKGFDDIVACTALYRPGSLGSGQTAKYVKISRGEDYETYSHPLLRPILGATKSIMIYQEQIMQIFVELAGFTWAQADAMRKIISKSMGPEEFEKHRTEFTDGCLVKGISPEISNPIFDSMVSFASYSFNKSHAVAYSFISWWSMFLKAHYPAEFFAALLTATTDDRAPVVIGEANRLGVKISLPDINLSKVGFFVLSEKEIVAPLTAIKGVGDKAGNDIVANRGSCPYTDKPNFLERITKRVVNKGVLEKLFKVGALRSIGLEVEDQEESERFLHELLPVYVELPRLSKKNLRYTKKYIADLYEEISMAPERRGRMVLQAKGGAGPSIMIVNNPQSNEDENLTADGTKYIYKVLAGIGITPAMTYYTCPIKYAVGKEKPEKDVEVVCAGWLEREIQIVQPRLIICCASNMKGMFTDSKAPMGELAGKVVYSKKYKCYVMFSYSPQYAYYQTERAGEQFVAGIKSLAQIFTEDDEQ